MGAVHFSIDTQLVERLKRLMPLTVFVETGTFHGDTVAAVRPYFDKLYSVEAVEEHNAIAHRRFASDDAVDIRLGESDGFLRELSPLLRDASVLYWLDAHWCETGGTNAALATQCPLLEEIAAIGTLNSNSVVLIDDARYFLSPPPAPNDPSHWPRLDRVLENLRGLSADHEVTVSNDVIIFAPKAIGDELRSFLQTHAVDWLKILHRAEDRDGQLRQVTAALRAAEDDRAALTAVVEVEREALRSSEAVSADLLEQIRMLQEQLKISEADRAARMDVIRDLQNHLQASDADRAARLDVIQDLQNHLQASDADRAARLDVIHDLQDHLRRSETDRAVRLDVIRLLQGRLRKWETARAARAARRRSRSERSKG